MELLILLAEKRGQLVTREQIIQRLWGDNVFVDTRQGINTAVRKIRVVLQDDPDHPRLLQTVAGGGYRLVAPVSTEEQSVHEQPAPQLPLPSSFPPSTPRASNVTAVRWRYVLVVAIVLVALVSAVFWLSLRGAAHPATEQRVTSNPPDAPIKFAVVSPDGKYVAYADPTGLYLRQISSGEGWEWRGVTPHRARRIRCDQIPKNATTFAAIWMKLAGLFCRLQRRCYSVIEIPELSNPIVTEPLQHTRTGILQSVGNIGSQTAKTTI